MSFNTGRWPEMRPLFKSSANPFITRAITDSWTPNCWGPFANFHRSPVRSRVKNTGGFRVQINTKGHWVKMRLEVKKNWYFQRSKNPKQELARVAYIVFRSYRNLQNQQYRFSIPKHWNSFHFTSLTAPYLWAGSIKLYLSNYQIVILFYSMIKGVFGSVAELTFWDLWVEDCHESKVVTDESVWKLRLKCMI